MLDCVLAHLMFASLERCEIENKLSLNQENGGPGRYVQKSKLDSTKLMK